MSIIVGKPRLWSLGTSLPVLAARLEVQIALIRKEGLNITVIETDDFEASFQYGGKRILGTFQTLHELRRLLE